MATDLPIPYINTDNSDTIWCFKFYHQFSFVKDEKILKKSILYIIIYFKKSTTEKRFAFQTSVLLSICSSIPGPCTFCSFNSIILKSKSENQKRGIFSVFNFWSKLYPATIEVVYHSNTCRKPMYNNAELSFLLTIGFNTVWPGRIYQRPSTLCVGSTATGFAIMSIEPYRDLIEDMVAQNLLYERYQFSYQR